MKVSTIFMLVLIMALKTTAQAYQPVDDKSTVKFVIKNFRINTGGNFKGLQGAISWDAAALEKSAFDISIDAASVNTDNESRDHHLRQEDYFNVQQYPKITFKSDRITKSGKSFTAYGKLSIKGTTKDISIPFTATDKDDGWLFDGSFRLNRRDYKVGGNSVVLSDEVIISLSVFAVRK